MQDGRRAKLHTNYSQLLWRDQPHIDCSIRVAVTTGTICLAVLGERRACRAATQEHALVEGLAPRKAGRAVLVRFGISRSGRGIVLTAFFPRANALVGTFAPRVPGGRKAATVVGASSNELQAATVRIIGVIVHVLHHSGAQRGIGLAVVVGLPVADALLKFRAKLVSGGREAPRIVGVSTKQPAVVGGSSGGGGHVFVRVSRATFLPEAEALLRRFTPCVSGRDVAAMGILEASQQRRRGGREAGSNEKGGEFHRFTVVL
mmetsp:Transcript_48886/g.72632  ORF Transcript_48886/g.72632 Transcript_48886/m.72632 type:complete len:261 (+) Transcript_48886:72-854(+)